MRLPDPSGTRVLLFGSSTYDDPDLLSLPAVDRNLADLAALFTDPAYCGIPAERVEVEPAPVLPAVGRRIDELARTAEDTLIVYYAGHGIPSDRGKLYLSLPITAPDAPHWTAIDFELIRAAMAGSSARNRVLILDCCFAGRAIETMADSATLVAAETEIYGTHTLASAGPNVPAVAPVGAVHTAFTGSLLSLARDGVENAGPLLSLDVLFRELVARQRRGGFPVPTQRGTDTTLHLALFRNQADLVDQMVSVDEAGTVDQPEPPVDLRLELQLALDRIRGFEVELKARMVTYVLSQASALKWTPDNGLADLHVRHRRRLDSFLQEVAVWLASSREAVRPLLDGVADDDPAVEHLRGLHREYLEGLEQWVMVRRTRAATLTTDISASVLSQSEFRSLLTAYFDTEYGDLHRL